MVQFALRSLLLLVAVLASRYKLDATVVIEADVKRI